MSAVIQVSGLRKRYGQLEAVRGIDFEVNEGEVFAFLGPNGAGKTTTVEILEGYRSPDGGTVRVLGIDPRGAPKSLRQRIGIVLQEHGVQQDARVRELLELFAGYYPSPRKPDDVLELVGLTETAQRLVRVLSGGERRRLDFALALIGNPDLIFLDEPTTGFDPGARRNSWDVIRTLCDLGKTIFLTTHYMDEAQVIADRIAIIARGEIVAEGTPESLGGRNVAASTIRFVLPPDVTSADLPDLGESTIDMQEGSVQIRTSTATATLAALTTWAVNRRLELANLTVSQPSLEDVYLELVHEGEELAEVAS
jgi:ABC-2 type transport system ATP-binding protein